MRILNYKWVFRTWSFMLLIINFTIQTGCQRKIEVKSIERQKMYENYIDTIIVERNYYNEIDKKRILIKDEKTFVNIIEPILFDIYGRENIISERPYEVYFAKNYWIISGYLPPYVVGGVFMAIMDARTCEIIRIEHGE